MLGFRKLFSLEKKVIKLLILICSCYAYILYSNRQTIVNNIYIDNSYNSNQNETLCVYPKLQPWHPDVKVFVKVLKPLVCNHMENWIYVKKGTLQISSQAVKQHGHVTCDYTPYIRKSEDVTLQAETIKNVKNGTAIIEDFFKINCTSQDLKTYQNVHAGIAYKDAVHSQIHTVPASSLGLNVLMFGFDSLSRMNWMRQLPHSHDYFVNKLGATVLEGYNIVGDGTGKALFPILTGKTELEMPETRRGIANAKPVDGHPWIWKEFKKLGYVTLYGEDQPAINTFNLRLLGFREKPVDHYMRPFYLKAAAQYRNHKKYCLGSVPRHKVMLDYIYDLYDLCPKPKFSFVFSAELSHDDFNLVSIADDDLTHFLQDMDSSGYLNNTLLILMSDHGSRFQNVRQVMQGKYEERMPYFGFRFPTWFKEKFPQAMRNLEINAHRLTTPFDIHATFMDVVNFTGAVKGDIHQRGISLMKEVPADRTCDHAHIPPHYCICLDWVNVTNKNKVIIDAANHLVKTINKITNTYRDHCIHLSLLNITAAAKYTPKKQLLKFKKSIKHGVADMNDDMKSPYVFYQITIITTPGLGQFEATLKQNIKDGEFSLNDNDISRTNQYGSQAHCVINKIPHLRSFCYCQHQLK